MDCATTINDEMKIAVPMGLLTYKQEASEELPWLTMVVVEIWSGTSFGRLIPSLSGTSCRCRSIHENGRRDRLKIDGIAELEQARQPVRHVHAAGNQRSHQ